MSTIDDLKRIRGYVDDCAASSSGAAANEGNACVALLDQVIDEYLHLKEVIFNYAQQRANWINLIQELEDKIKKHSECPK